MKKIEIPESIYTSDKSCAEFIVTINENLSKLSAMEKELNEAKKIASEHLLARLDATGQKHFAFEDLGTFKRNVSMKFSYPSDRELMAEWLTDCVNRGLLTTKGVLDIQQARLNTEPVENLLAAVEAYNEQQKLNGSEDLIPDSPFNKYPAITLSAPRSRKN